MSAVLLLPQYADSATAPHINMADSTGSENRPDAGSAMAWACLDRILASPCFVQSERQQRFLKFIVSETLAGRTDRLKGYTIALEVFDRDVSFDPAVDAIVRVEAARLRAKLREYYDREGRTDPVRFELPKGAYAIRMEWQAPETTPPLQAPRAAHAIKVEDAMSARPPPIEDRPSLAVLPFANMSSNPEQEYFADGITDGLIAELSRLPGLFVISRHSSFVYKGVSKRAEDIGAELGIRYLLEGSVQCVAERVRITVQLIDAASGAHLWAERYDREIKDIFALQDDVTQRVVNALQVKFAPAEQERIGHGGTINVEAHDCLLRGLERFWIFTPESTSDASVHVARAVALDPGYAAGHIWLARVLVFRWAMIWDPNPQALERAYSHIRVAVDLDPKAPHTQAVLCWVQLWRKQGEAAIAAGWRAVALDPNNADAHLFLAFVLAVSGRGEEALHNIVKGMRLNPHPGAVYHLALCFSYIALEEYELAISACKRGIEVTDVFIPNHYMLCLLHTLLGRYVEADAEREKLMALTGGRKPVVQSMWLDEDLRLRFDGLARLAGLEHTGPAATPS
jgi:adenylate cyclase